MNGSAEASLARERASSSTDRRVPYACLLVFAAVWTALAINPVDRGAWVLESFPTLAALPAIFVLYRFRRLSNRAYIFTTAFLILHTVGSHYTYSQVPVGNWARDVFSLSRNHYDRLVHFTFGLLVLLPNLELAFGPVHGRRPWLHYYVGFTSVAWWSLFYELMEWLTVRVAEPSAGMAFLGTQGDVWDSQKDMALACAGAILAIAVELGAASGPSPRTRAKG